MKFAHTSSALLLVGICYLCPSTAYADRYPRELIGVWGNRAEYQGHDSATTAQQACASYWKNPAEVDGIVIVFQGTEKRYVGGFGENAAQNISVRQIAPNKWRIADRHYNDGEGGSKPGYITTRYEASIDNGILSIKEGNDTSRYNQCQQVPAKEASQPFPQEQGRTQLTFSIGSRVGMTATVTRFARLNEPLANAEAKITEADNLAFCSEYVLPYWKEEGLEKLAACLKEEQGNGQQTFSIGANCKTGVLQNHFGDQYRVNPRAGWDNQWTLLNRKADSNERLPFEVNQSQFTFLCPEAAKRIWPESR